jgi:hypothetical protein
VRECREKYPDKAVIYSADGGDNYGWAVFMAGGSLANIPATNTDFLKDAGAMQPAGTWTLKGKNGMIIYCSKVGDVQADLSTLTGSFRVRRIDPSTGVTEKTMEKIHGGKIISLSTTTPVILWITR